jgi:serine/threonine protein kinase/tetratricopeptide (TPR) repeat protein
MTEEELFEAARHMSDAAQRAAYLEHACAGNLPLRQRIEALLRSDAEAKSFLGQPAVQEGATGEEGPRGEPGDAERPGTRIGPYKLLQALGEGGMGAVYLAEQHEPVQRRVALKIIKAGMDSARVVARFEAERQALAVMDHPSIAKVFDAGTTHSGRPYFVMELVKGIPITTFCDQEYLTPKERLELFIPVCQAVQHAHQKGIIHRDLKPSNVLIALYDGKPMPKVIDFGVAKATGQKLTERTMFTEVGQIVGTLEYMSPEQAELNNLDIDTRADIYSLGVLLYELLTGSTPFTAKQLRSAAFTEMLRMIREVEPAKPSTKLSGSAELPAIAAKRKLEPAKLARLLRGDLDWIVMKCLEKERGRRYETANGLAMDVQRYLADEAVLASPPSARYRLRKFMRRHRGPVLAAAIIAVLLVGGIAGTSVGFLRADRLRQVAENKEQEARGEKAKAEASQQRAMDALAATTDEVIEQLLSGKPVLGLSEKAFLEATLRRWQTFAAEQGDSERARAIRAEGTLRVAHLRWKFGQYDARAGYEEAIKLYGTLAEDFPAAPKYRENLAVCHNGLGILLRDVGQRSEAEMAYRHALVIQEKLTVAFPAEPGYGWELATSHKNLGILLRDVGKRSEAEMAYRHALAIQERLAADFRDVPRYRLELASTQSALGNVLRDLGKRTEAEAALRQALANSEKLTADFPAVPLYRLELARSHSRLGLLLADAGKGSEANAAYCQALAIEEKLTAGYPTVLEYRQELAATHNNLGNLLRDLGKRPQAEVAYRQALAINEKLTAEFPIVAEYRGDLAVSNNNLGNLLRDVGKPREAEAVFRQALAIQDKLADEFPAVPRYRQALATSHNNLGILFDDQGNRPEAETAYRLALAIQEKLTADFPGVPEYRRDLGRSQVNLGTLQQSNQQPEKALQWYARSIKTLTQVLREVRVDATAQQFLRGAHTGRALVLDNLKRHAEAAKDWDRALELAPESERPAVRINRAASQARSGLVDAALKEAEELAKTADANTLYDAACIFALAAAGREGGSSVKEDRARRAVGLLRQAVARGYKDAEHMKKDDDLETLRQRDDFKKLLAELEKKSP